MAVVHSKSLTGTYHCALDTWLCLTLRKLRSSVLESCVEVPAYVVMSILLSYLLRYAPRILSLYARESNLLHSHLNFWEAMQWCCARIQQGEGGQASAEDLHYTQYHELHFMCHEFNQNRAHGTACSAGLLLMPAHLLLASSPNIVACFVLQQSNPNCFISKLLTWHKAGYEIHHMTCHTNMLCVKAPPQ